MGLVRVDSSIVKRQSTMQICRSLLTDKFAYSAHRRSNNRSINGTIATNGNGHAIREIETERGREREMEGKTYVVSRETGTAQYMCYICTHPVRSSLEQTSKDITLLLLLCRQLLVFQSLEFHQETGPLNRVFGLHDNFPKNVISDVYSQIV